MTRVLSTQPCEGPASAPLGSGPGTGCICLQGSEGLLYWGGGGGRKEEVSLAFPPLCAGGKLPLGRSALQEAFAVALSRAEVLAVGCPAS